MLTVADLANASRGDLEELLRRGHRVTPADLAGWAFRGTSLGLPAIVERATWKTFQKGFVADETRGGVRGWNVRVEQRGIGAPTVAKKRAGVPWTFGHFRVRGAAGLAPAWCAAGVLLDYGAFARAFDPVSRVRDPIVAVDEASTDLLLGWSYVDVAGRCVPTPSFFALEREAPVDHVPTP